MLSSISAPNLRITFIVPLKLWLILCSCRWLQWLQVKRIKGNASTKILDRLNYFFEILMLIVPFSCALRKTSFKIKRYYENMKRIYRKTPMSKCNFNNVALQESCVWILVKRTNFRIHYYKFQVLNILINSYVLSHLLFTAIETELGFNRWIDALYHELPYILNVETLRNQSISGKPQKCVKLELNSEAWLGPWQTSPSRHTHVQSKQ